eukprot:2887168-Alexandrium_andersonii.AAC.1
MHAMPLHAGHFVMTCPAELPTRMALTRRGSSGGHAIQAGLGPRTPAPSEANRKEARRIDGRAPAFWAS